MFGENIKKIREIKGLGLNELSRISGVNASYISALERDEKKNPSVSILEKIANALEVSIDEIMKNDNKLIKIKKENSYEAGEFTTAEAAMQFILKQPAIMGFGGFDTNKMSDEEIIEFANELLNQMKLISYKYKK